MPNGPIALDALGPAGTYRAQKQQIVTDVAGRPVAALSLVPPLYVSRAVAALRGAAPLPPAERAAAIADATRAHAYGVVDGMTAADHHRLVSRTTGMPISAVRGVGEALARSARDTTRNVALARPSGAAADWHDPATRGGHGVWTRRGTVFGVHAPGNTPGVHGLWLDALALGYHVVVRPSRRDPFTPHRLVSALRASGFGSDRVVLLPTDHETADTVLREADLSIAYGDDAVMRKYAAMATVLPQGPGRSKILLTADVDWREHLDVIVESISANGGRECINATAVFVEGPGQTAKLAHALAERLRALPSLPPDDERAVLPVVPIDQGRALQRHLVERARGTVPWLAAADVVHDLGDGSAVMRPALHELARADAEQAGVELPFPCVWIAPWSREAGIGPLRDTLVLTAVTDDEHLVDALVAEPTISNVYVGGHPTCRSAPGLPHDSYLADHLMRTKTVIR